MTSVDDLIRTGLIERVPPDRDTAAVWLADASRHLDAAAHILDIDRAGAYGLAYDAARKAVAAHMLVHGLRVRSVPGAHRSIALYAESLASDSRDLARLDAMRRNRNRSEYGHRVFGRQEVAADLEHAQAIVALIHELLDV